MEVAAQKISSALEVESQDKAEASEDLEDMLLDILQHLVYRVTGKNGSEQNDMNKMVWTKWYTDKMVLDKL